jgi:hypothetical protein
MNIYIVVLLLTSERTASDMPGKKGLPTPGISKPAMCETRGM